MAPGWLGPAERDELARIRHPLRRQQWLTGRRLARQLVCQQQLTHAPCRWNEIEILSRDAAGRGTRPRLRVLGRASRWSLSISHHGAWVLVALAASPHTAVGVDILRPQPLTPRFAQLWFTPAERTWLEDCGLPHAAARLWSAKEAVYKACGDGRRFTPRTLPLRPLPPAGWELQVAGPWPADSLRIHSTELAGCIATFATARRLRGHDHLSGGSPS